MLLPNARTECRAGRSLTLHVFDFLVCEHVTGSYGISGVLLEKDKLR